MSVGADADRDPSVLQSVERVLARKGENSHDRTARRNLKRAGLELLAGLALVAGTLGLVVGGDEMATAYAAEDATVVVEPTSSVTVRDLQRYNGFEDYAAQGQQMENSDVGCFANECKRETASCFTDGSCLKVKLSSTNSDISSCCIMGPPLVVIS